MFYKLERLSSVRCNRRAVGRGNGLWRRVYRDMKRKNIRAEKNVKSRSWNLPDEKRTNGWRVVTVLSAGLSVFSKKGSLYYYYLIHNGIRPRALCLPADPAISRRRPSLKGCAVTERRRRRVRVIRGCDSPGVFWKFSGRPSDVRPKRWRGKSICPLRRPRDPPSSPPPPLARAFPSARSRRHFRRVRRGNETTASPKLFTPAHTIRTVLRTPSSLRSRRSLLKINRNAHGAKRTVTTIENKRQWLGGGRCKG